MFIQDRNEARRFFIDVWHKYRNNKILEPLETLVLAVIHEHPEYQSLLLNKDVALSLEHDPDSGLLNPFLHMGMHIAIREQLQADRPAGIRLLHQQMLAKYADSHELEHSMMECLGQVLWSAQREQRPPDEGLYLECLRRLR